MATTLSHEWEPDRAGRVLFLLALVALLLHGVYATATHRGLYGDASWFLLRILSENKVTNFYSDFSREFYYSRFVAYHLTQLPTVLAQAAGMSDPSHLSWVLNATYFSHKLLSLVLCYLLLPVGKKLFVVFPILGIFAGSMVSEIYIVTETHLAASVFWPIIIAICFSPVLHKLRFALLAGAILLSAFVYESFAFLGVFWLGFAVLRAVRTPSRGQKAAWLLIAAACLVPIMVSWAAILFPRDPTNKSAFTGGLLRLLSDTRSGIPSMHVAATMAIVAIAALMPLLLSRRFRKSSASMHYALLAAIVLAAFPVVHFALYWESIDFTQAITDRVVGGLALQLVLATRFSLTVLVPSWLGGSARVMVPIVAGLIVGQAAYQMLNTATWDSAIARLGQTQGVRSGLIYCNGMSTPLAPAARQLADRTLCRWWILPLGVVLSDGGTVRTLVKSENEPFLPFDPTSTSALPKADDNLDYRPYVAALASRPPRGNEGEAAP